MSAKMIEVRQEKISLVSQYRWMRVSENFVDIFRLISESHSLSPRIPFGSSLGWGGQSLLFFIFHLFLLVGG